MTTIGTYFSGFGGVDIGAMAAGVTPIFAVEWDADLAAVYRQNVGDHVIVADVTKLDVGTLPEVDIFHASPPCTNASVANANAGESPFDMEMATAVCRYIVAKRPSIFTLENVYMYRTFESWRLIARTLLDCGYTYNYWHCNFADYGVPQTRKRMIVIARRDGKTPMLPEATHAENPQSGLFGTKKRWVSWYEAVEDLIPTLPDSQFAPWQLKRLPEEYKTILVKNGDEFPTMPDKTTPCYTVSSSTCSLGKAFIMNGANPNGNETKKYREGDQPLKTVTSDISGARAFVMSGVNASTARPKCASEPSRTATSSDYKGFDIASVNGRVVKMTPRAIARVQSFPDSYVLPDRATLAVKGLGNAVPPLFAQRLYESLRETT